MFLAFISSRFKYLAGLLGMALTVLVAFFSYGAIKKKEGSVGAATEALKADTIKKEKANAATFKEKRTADGLSDSDVLDRLRRRRDDWGSL